MKTKDLIKMLQEADPKGEGHVRMAGGVPYYAESKEGYWDGPYSYIDENGNYVYSIQGYKIDLCCKDIQDFVCDEIGIDADYPWEKIKEKFKFEIGGYSIESQRNERAESVLKEARETYDMITNLNKNSLAKSIQDSLKRIEEGWRHFQNKDVDKNERPNMHVYYTWKFIKPDGKYDSGSNIYMTQGFLKSDLFMRVDNEVEKGYYEWILKK